MYLDPFEAIILFTVTIIFQRYCVFALNTSVRIFFFSGEWVGWAVVSHSQTLYQNTTWDGKGSGYAKDGVVWHHLTKCACSMNMREAMRKKRIIC